MTATLRARITGGERLLGVLLRVPAEELTEMAALSGFDFVFLDCEHGPAEVVEVRRHIAYAALHGVPCLVRTGANEPGAVLRALDAGAAGIIAPHIDGAEQAAALVDSAHYPPLGNRGFATYSRAGRFGQVTPAEHRLTAAEETVVVAMIESPVGAAAVDDIAAVSGVDVIMIGVADLGASSGAGDPPLAASIERVHSALAASTVARMDIVTSAGQARAAFSAGAQLVVYNLTHTLMDHLAALRSVER